MGLHCAPQGLDCLRQCATLQLPTTHVVDALRPLEVTKSEQQAGETSRLVGIQNTEFPRGLTEQGDVDRAAILPAADPSP